MPEKESNSDKKNYYNSPTKGIPDTPIRAAFKSSNYQIGPFLKKLSEIKGKVQKIEQTKSKNSEISDDKENLDLIENVGYEEYDEFSFFRTTQNK